MVNFFILRLGADSESDIREIDKHASGDRLPIKIDVRCKQVPTLASAGDYVVVWLGTNNNKGGKTPWMQGVRALGKIVSVTGPEGYNIEKTVRISLYVVLTESVSKIDFVNQVEVPYQRIAAMPVLGVNNYSSQVVQKIDPNEQAQDLPSLFLALEALRPGFKTAVLNSYSELSRLFERHQEQAHTSPKSKANVDGMRGLEVPSGDDDIEGEDKAGAESVTKPWNPNDIRITTKSFSIRELFTQIEEEELDLAPDFQRAFVWSDRQQVRLVESILLGIPLPAFYFNQDKSGAHQVVDGVQRLTTVRHFMSDELQLREDYLEYLQDLKELTYSTLDPATRRRFAGTQIVAHVIEPQTPDEVKYDIFSRVNTGGSPLTAQEIRHCMSKTRSRAFLRGLVEHPEFDRAMEKSFWSRDLFGNWIRNNRRMTDREMALRFCAFYMQPLSDYAKATSLDGYLLAFTRRIDQDGSKGISSTQLEATEAAFVRAMQNCHSILGRGAFRRWPPKGRRGPLNRAIFESQALALADYSLTDLLPSKVQLQNALRNLFEDATYENAVRFGTGSYSKVESRLAIARQAVREALDD